MFETNFGGIGAKVQADREQTTDKQVHQVLADAHAHDAIFCSRHDRSVVFRDHEEHLHESRGKVR